MDGSLEPLAERLRSGGSRAAQLAAALIGGVVFAYPLATFLVTSLAGFDFHFSTIFLELLARALGFTLLQSALSATLALLLALPLAVALALAEGADAARLRRIAEAAGSLIFALPGVLVSLFILTSASYVPGLPSVGLGAIVFAHVLVYLLFVASAVAIALRSFVLARGGELLAAATLLGASPWRARLAVLGPRLALETRLWWPLVFLGAFGSFSTVVILGGGPQASSPEVLLYFALQTDPDPARLLLLVLAQFLVALGLAFWARRREESRVAEEASEVMDRDHSEQALATQVSVAAPMAAGLAVVAFFLPLLYSAGAAVLRTSPPDGFAGAWRASLILASGTTLALVFVQELLLRVGTRVRGFVFLLSGFSPALLSAAWIAAGVDIPIDSEWARIALCSAGLALTFAPLVAYWTERELQRFPANLLEAGASLGASDTELRRFVLRPALRPLRVRVLYLAALGALGDLTFSTLFLHETETLATLSRRLAHRYDFTGSSWILVALFAVATVTWAATRLRKKRR